MKAMVCLNWIAPEKFAIIYTKMVVDMWICLHLWGRKKIASWMVLLFYQMKDYFRLVKKRGNLEFYSII